jgi:carotenoid cleavage dioxygenase
MMSEFVHAPKHAEAAEDDGWLMGFVYDKARNGSDFWILDAATLETQARVALPRRVPQGFHGSWCPGF